MAMSSDEHETGKKLNSDSGGGQNGETANFKVLKIVNKRGLHARASAKFVNCVEKFDAKIRVSKDGHVVGGTSIMGLMMLAASPGCSIHVTAEGPDAEKALNAISELVEDRFGEGE